MFSFCARFPVSSHGHPFVSLSLLRFYPTYFRGLATILDLAVFLFYSGVADFTSSFVSAYFISFILLVILWYSLIVPFYFTYTVLSEYGSDNSSELVSHQMAHPSLCRTRFPS